MSAHKPIEEAANTTELPDVDTSYGPLSDVKSRFFEAHNIATGVATWLAHERIGDVSERVWLSDMPVLNERLLADFGNAAFSLVEVLEDRIRDLEGEIHSSDCDR